MSHEVLQETRKKENNTREILRPFALATATAGDRNKQRSYVASNREAQKHVCQGVASLTSLDLTTATTTTTPSAPSVIL